MRARQWLGAGAVLLLTFASADAALAGDPVPASPADRPLPKFPAGAGSTQGAVRLTFDLRADGHVGNLRVLDSTPAAIFDKAALDAVSRWTYHARTLDGRPVPQPGNVVVLRFKPNPLLVALFKPDPEYPREAYLDRREGAVSLRFDIDAQGSTANIQVAASLPPGVFDRVATEAVKAWRFKPDPAYLPASGIETTIPFSLKDASVPRVPEKPLSPIYPVAAEDSDVMGDCIVDYTIEANGSVSGAAIRMCSPGGYFEQASLDAANGARYKVETDPLLNQAHHHSLHLSYRLQGVSETEVHYLKPGQWVKLQYTLTAQGHARQIKVLATSPPTLFPKRAIEQLRDMTLQPVIENGVAIEKPGQVMTIGGG